MSDHDRFRDLTAAYVLGALDQEERAELLDHLHTCQRCQADIVDFAPLPALLGRVDVADLDDPVTSHVADSVVAGARRHLDRVRSSRRRWRTTAGLLGAAAMILVALGVASLVLDPGESEEPRTERIELAFDAVGDTIGAIAVDERGWGTYVHVSVEGLPPRDRYLLWAVAGTGTWHEAGSWGPSPGGDATLGGSVHLFLDEIDHLLVTSDDVEDVLLRTTAERDH